MCVVVQRQEELLVDNKTPTEHAHLLFHRLMAFLRCRDLMAIHRAPDCICPGYI